MLQSNSRVEMSKGIKFYEQDILFDDYSFANDIQITLVVDYIAPGIGIALMNNEGSTIREKDQVYLFRLGYKESSVLYRNGDTRKKLYNTAVNVYPLRESMILTFTKRGKDVTMTVDNTNEVIKFTLPKQMDKYNIGFYSNAGNVIKNIAIASLIPEGWTVNMRNSGGGYIKFIKNGFSVEGCLDKAEIEQSGIELDAGTYYLKYDKENIANKNDITAYVFKSDDTRIFDDEKNILQNGKLVIEDGTSVNIKFKGTNGTIKNVMITDSKDNVYVPTYESGRIVTSGSYMDINLDNIQSINWTGTIYDTPSEIDLVEKETFALIAAEGVNIGLINLGVIRNKEYSYVFTVATKTLTVYDNGIAIKQFVFKEVVNKITLFKNITALITKFTLIQNDGEVINLIAEKTSKKYVPGGITSPIVVSDEEGMPLDLSSSYRVTKVNGEDKYLFTNYEREYFEPVTRIKLTNKVSAEPGSIKLYGILKEAKVNFDNILRIAKPGIDTIDMFCEKYDTYNERDLLYIDKVTSEIYLENAGDYKMIVVDYLKKDSYCINYMSDLKMYEVDISTDRENVSLMYDNGINGSSVFSSVSNYKVLDIAARDNCYIVLRRS